MMMIRKKIVVLAKGIYQVSLMNSYLKNSLKGIRNIANGTLILSKSFNTMKQFDIHSIQQTQINNNTTNSKQQSPNINNNNKNQQSNIIENNNQKINIFDNLLNLHKKTKQLLQQLQQQMTMINHHHFNDTLSPQQQQGHKQQQQKHTRSKLLLLFDQQQYLKRMVQMKYYYSDIVNVASQLIQLLINCDNDNIISSSTTITITPTIKTTHLHFLLYVYHLYPRQCKDLKQRITLLLEQFIDNNSNNHNTITLKSNMQLMFYLRKFIQNEQYHQLNQHITKVNVKYVKWLRSMYGREKDLMLEELQQDKGIKQNKDDNGKDNNNSNDNKQMISRLQLLHDYLLVFPNMWNTNISTSSSSTKKQSNNSNNKQNTKKNPKHKPISLTTTTSIPPQQIIQTFDYFTQQYKQYTTHVIKHYLENIRQINSVDNNNNNNMITNQQTKSHQQHKNNTTKTYKHLLQNQLKRKSSSYKHCFNLIKLLTHRLLVIFNLPINNIKGVKQQQKQSKQKQTQTQEQLNADKQLQLLMKKYCDNKINLLKYLPVSKMESQQQLIAVLVLVKQLIASYHIVRDVRHQHITNYLLQLLKNNEHLIVVNKGDSKNNLQLKRQIKQKINQLVSKLASCSWVDKDDEINQYLSLFQFTQTNKYTSLNQKKINKDSWYQVNSQ